MMNQCRVGNTCAQLCTRLRRSCGFDYDSVTTVREGAATTGSAAGGGTRTTLKKKITGVRKESGSSGVRIAVGVVLAMGRTCAAPLESGSLFYLKAEASMAGRGRWQEEDKD